MKKNAGVTIASIGMLVTILGLTVFTENKTLQVISTSLGVILTIVGAVKSDQDKKKKKKGN